jgi:hypothetical protein
LVLGIYAATDDPYVRAALAIGRVAIDRVAIRRARFAKLEVEELTVRKLHVLENSGSMW